VRIFLNFIEQSNWQCTLVTGENSVATDKLFHKLATSHAAAILKLFKIPDYNDYQASSFTFKEVENRRDIIFEKSTGDEAVLLEAQGYDDEYFLHRTIMGRMMYHLQKKFTGKLRTIVMFLEESHYYAALKLAHHFDGSSELAFQPTVFIFDQKEVSELENLDDVRLVPLYPLCKVSPDQIRATAPKWAERIKTATELSEAERRDLLSYLGGFMMHRLKESNLENINQLLGGSKMEDTQAGKDLIAIGVRQGQELGTLLAMRENIIDLLTAKLGQTEKTWRKELNTIKDIKVLKTLYRAILNAKSRKQAKDAFEAVLGNGKKTK
jgi:hypothetical protein